MSLSIQTIADAGATKVLVAGEVDVSNADKLREAVDAALAAAGGELTVDLAEVPYIDSTGIGVLVGAAHRAADAAKKLIVANPQKNVARVLGLLGVAGDLNI
ncbi:STAS domain-containing protein [Paratractidigestivibacter sp.]|uniref:STAS domain-containing protein n=1 Tax=Paratractidigestivibacter sp. TaxID=2847316 RepID=UPI002ABDEF48|nr:STAS domain-containing protein [Paratractidigestivibacter sp.]